LPCCIMTLLFTKRLRRSFVIFLSIEVKCTSDVGAAVFLFELTL